MDIFHAKISSLNSDEGRSQQIEIVAIFLRVMLYSIYLQNLAFNGNRSLYTLIQNVCFLVLYKAI